MKKRNLGEIQQSHSAVSAIEATEFVDLGSAHP